MENNIYDQNFLRFAVYTTIAVIYGIWWLSIKLTEKK